MDQTRTSKLREKNNLLKLYRDEREALKAEIEQLQQDLRDNEDKMWDLQQEIKALESEAGE